MGCVVRAGSWEVSLAMDWFRLAWCEGCVEDTVVWWWRSGEVRGAAGVCTFMTFLCAVECVICAEVRIRFIVWCISVGGRR